MSGGEEGGLSSRGEKGVDGVEDLEQEEGTRRPQLEACLALLEVAQNTQTCAMQETMQAQARSMEKALQAQPAQTRSTEEALQAQTGSKEEAQQKQMRQMEEALQAQQTQIRFLEERVVQMETTLLKVMGSVMPKVEELLARHSRPVSGPSSILKEAPRFFAKDENSLDSDAPTAPSSIVEVTTSSTPIGGSEKSHVAAFLSSFGSTSNTTASTNPTHSLFPDEGSFNLKALSTPPTSELPIHNSAPIAVQSVSHNMAPEDSTMTLHQAAMRGDLIAVRRLLAAGGSMHDRDKCGNTVLHVAATHGHLEVMDALIATDTDVERMGHNGRSALHCAAAEGQLRIVERLVAAGAKLERRDFGGSTAVALAARGGHGEAVRFLLRSGASPETADKDGKMPLLCALDGGHAEVAMALVESGAALDKTDKEGNTPLLRAIKAEYWDLVRLLVKKGAKLNVVEASGDTPLLCAVRAKNFDIVKLLLEKGSSPEGCNQEGDTVLHSAVKSGRLPVVEILLECAADVDNANKVGNTPLLCAVEIESWEIVTLLLRKGASPFKHNKNVESAVSLVAKKGNAHILRDMLKFKPHANSKVLERCLFAASSPEVVWALLDAARDSLSAAVLEEGLRKAAGAGRLEVLNTLLQMGVDPLKVDGNSRRALDYALQGGHISCIRALVKEWNPTKSESVLRLAASLGHEGLVTAMLDDGAAINATDKDGRSALHWAAREGKPNCVNLLLKRGAEKNLKNDWGDTALHEAAYFSHSECVTLLCAAGAKLTVKHNGGDTPYDVATDEEVRLILREYFKRGRSKSRRRNT